MKRITRLVLAFAGLLLVFGACAWLNGSAAEQTSKRQTANQGYPWINLGEPREITTKADLLAARPTTMIAGDFTRDGMPDLISGYDNGHLVLQPGNVNTLWPAASSSEPPFLPTVQTFDSELQPSTDLEDARAANAKIRIDLVSRLTEAAVERTCKAEFVRDVENVVNLADQFQLQPFSDEIDFVR